MFQMMGAFAEFERAMIQERVRAGRARAKSEGKRQGATARCKSLVMNPNFADGLLDWSHFPLGQN